MSSFNTNRHFLKFLCEKILLFFYMLDGKVKRVKRVKLRNIYGTISYKTSQNILCVFFPFVPACARFLSPASMSMSLFNPYVENMRIVKRKASQFSCYSGELVAFLVARNNETQNKFFCSFYVPSIFPRRTRLFFCSLCIPSLFPRAYPPFLLCVYGAQNDGNRKQECNGSAMVLPQLCSNDLYTPE